MRSNGRRPVPTLSPSARLALLFSLLIATVLGMQRYARVRERADYMAFAAVLKGGLADTRQTTALTPDGVGLHRATALGVVAGLVLCWTVMPAWPPLRNVATYIWFATIIMLVSALFVRGVTLTRGGGRAIREMIDNRLVIDLLRIDRLSVIGRSAARGALVWFVISAVVCLFFIGGRIDDFTVALLLSCAAMGVWIFVATMERVHRNIRAAKATELEHLRAQADGLRDKAAADPMPPNVFRAFSPMKRESRRRRNGRSTRRRWCASSLRLLSSPCHGSARRSRRLPSNVSPRS